jgi:hypothetical protein
LITIEFELDEYKSLTDDELAGNVDIPYNITFSYQGLSHTDLTIAFAFEWHFYLVLYLLIGTLSVFIMIIFLLYHRIVARGNVAKFKFWSTLKLTIPPAMYGISIAIAPVFFINLFIAVLMVGQILENKTRLRECSADIEDNECPFSLFDPIKDDPSNVNVDYQILRTGRCGLAFIIVGAYLMMLGLKIMIPEKHRGDMLHVQEAYDGNVWNYFTWKRSNMIFISVFWIFYNLMVVQFSFSDVFSNNIWMMIGLLKVLGIILGLILEFLVEESLLSSPLEILGGLAQGLVTFGADDFVDFLTAYFIELGIMMFERTYAGEFVDFTVKYIRLKFSKLLDFRNVLFQQQEGGMFDDPNKKKSKILDKEKKEEQENAHLMEDNKVEEK